METIYFTLTAIALYLAADWIVQRAEIAHGERFEYRTLYFSIILLTLALGSFYVIRLIVG
jgi:hypothetical protein